MSAARTIATASTVSTGALVVKDRNITNAITATPSEARAARIERLVRDYHVFVWRSARRLGVRSADLDDVVQEVFLTAAKHLDAIEQERERGYLFQTCIFFAARARRGVQRRREIVDEERLSGEIDGAAGPEQSAVNAESLAQMQIIIDAMPKDNRLVFFLFEIEQMTMAEVGEALGLPQGTVASRLRRARELFMAHPLAIAAMGVSNDD